MAKKKQKSAEELFGVAVADRFSSSNEDDGDYSGITFLDQNGKPISAEEWAKPLKKTKKSKKK